MREYNVARDVLNRSTAAETLKESALIAIVEDDEGVRRAVHELLKSAGLTPRSFASAEEFLEFHQRHEALCVISDIRMPGMSGLDLQAKLAEEGSHVPIIFITAYGDATTRTRALNGGALDVLEKPFDGGVLLERVLALVDV